MSLVEVEFAFFLPLVLILHWLLPRRAWLQNGFLLLASALFYASWHPRLLWLLFASALLDWWVGLRLAATPRPAAEDTTPQARAARRVRLAWLLVSLGAGIGGLAFCKYAGFFVEPFADLLRTLGFVPSTGPLHVILPLGISFQMLQRLGYTVDVYYGREPACRDPLRFALFVAFFPQLTAGPISRAAQLLPQLAQARRLDFAAIRTGAGELLLGFALKAFAADTIGRMVVDPVFAAPGTFAPADHVLAMFANALQIYADFAGYSLMAIGAGRLFGIQLPENFSVPFLSRNLPEFWRRWHITLNRWLFDFIFTPLTAGHGLMRGRIRTGFLLVFVLSGVWHASASGAMTGYVLWGFLHGVGMTVQATFDEQYRGLCRRDRVWVQRRKSRGYQVAAWALTQLFFVSTLIPFRAASLGDAAAFLGGFVGTGAQRVPVHGLTQATFLGLALALPIAHHLVALDACRGLWTRITQLPAPVRGVLVGLALVVLTVVVPVGASTFLYRQF